MLLSVDRLEAGYDKAMILRSVSLSVAAGEIVGLVGRNGSGRSTLVKALMGLVNRSGMVTLGEQRLDDLQPHDIARAGLAMVPEGREVFPGLTVQQNLSAGWMRRPGGQNQQALMGAMLQMFPRLGERLHVAAGQLSGGEQQMLSIARSLMTQPSCLLLDEPAEGLSLPMQQRLLQVLGQVRDTGTGILLIEQKMQLLPDICDRVLVMGSGEIRFSGSMRELQDNKDIRQRWLEI